MVVVSYCFQVRDAGNLLTRAGFSLPGVDVDDYVVKYKSGKKKIYSTFCSSSWLAKAFSLFYFFLFFDLSVLSAGSYRPSSCHGWNQRSSPQKQGMFFFLSFFCQTFRKCDIFSNKNSSSWLLPKQILNRETALATAAIYDSMFATEDGTIPATFQVCLIEISLWIVD